VAWILQGSHETNDGKQEQGRNGANGKSVGLSEQPTLLKKTVGKMGLKGVPGLITTNAL
jgi:hypothetical protein